MLAGPSVTGILRACRGRVARRRSGRHWQSPAALARSRQQACSV